jgi:hypothetical protein
LQATLKEAKIENPFKTLKDIKADTEIVMDDLVIGIETPLDTMIITSQDGRENDQENLSSHNNSITPPLNKGKAKSNKP